MKVVVNRCYGGFSLSMKAVARLAELQGKKAYFFKQTGISGKYDPVSPGTEPSLFYTAFSIPNPNDYFTEGKDWRDQTPEERQAENQKYSAVYLDARPEDRTNPLLIQVVEELGEEANGACAELEIREIPDGIKWHLDEYDGIESIHEDHRSW
jgi:hypothetical protein